MRKETISIVLLLFFILLLIVNVGVQSYKIKKDFEYQESAKKERLEAKEEAKKERTKIIEQNEELIRLTKQKK